MKKTTFQFQSESGFGGSDVIKSHTAAPRSNTTTLSSIIATNRAMLRPTYLTFKQPDLEMEFGRYFVKYNLIRWQRTQHALFAILTLLYLYFFIQNTFDSAYWTANYSPSVKGSITPDIIALFCPAGWYCFTCNPDMICSSYILGFDIAFWAVTVLVPYVIGIVVSNFFTSTYFTEYNDMISTVSLSFMTLVGVGIRYYIIEYGVSFMQPTLIMNMILLLGFYTLRIRFIYAVISIWWIIFLWIIINIPQLFLHKDVLHATGRSYGIAMACLVITGLIITLVSYETEYFHRMQFLMSKEMKKNNAKLTNQLKLLAKSYNKKAGSLDSPLERSVMVIRSVMADPVLSSQHLMALGQVLALLSSSNLLTPDLEGTIGDSLDNEQEAWLFSEIAARRRRGRAKSEARGKVSLAAEISNKAEVPIIEQLSLPKNIAEETEPSIQVGMMRFEEKLPTKIELVEDLGAAYPPIIEGIAPLLSRCVEYNWPIFDLTQLTQHNTLIVLAHHLFTTSNLFEAFSVPRDKFRSFIRTIERGYHEDLPYHNAIHATDVLHCMSFLANDEKIKQITSDVEVFSMYLAAIIHDHDHPGFTNNFLVNTNDQKALLYNDKSVLENHHVASSFNVLLQPENNFLSHLSKSDFKAIREIVVDLVLATDLTQHFTLLSMFKAKVASSETFDPYETREDRMLLYKIMMKCSDVSNPSKDMQLYESWCRLISEEFYRQGDMEKKLCLPVSPYMDRDNVNIPSSQVGFIDYVVMPLFDALDKFQPIPNILNRLQKNREYWAHQKLLGITQLQPGGTTISTSTSGGSTNHQRTSAQPCASQSQILGGSKVALSSLPPTSLTVKSLSEDLIATASPDNFQSAIKDNLKNNQ
ncbi:hypothetical protein RTP6_004631 [Batrachochytrium dendrobatidis]